MNLAESTYFDQLPYELKATVFSYFDVATLLVFCEAYPSFEHFSHDRDTIRYVNMYLYYRYKGSFIISFLSEKPRCERITVLNINGVRRLHKKDFFKCLETMTSLKCLYALKTSLNVTPWECQLYSSFKKLKEIGVNVSTGAFMPECVPLFPDVQALYLCIFHSNERTLHLIGMLIQKMKKLREFRLIDYKPNNNGLQYNLANYSPPTLNSVVFLNCCEIPWAEKTPAHFIKTFDNKQYCGDDFPVGLCSFERRKYALNIYNNWEPQHPIWKDVLETLDGALPFGPKDCRKLAFKQRNLNNIELEELRFPHINSECTLIYNALMLPNCVYLRKLRVDCCVFDEIWLEESDERGSLRNIVGNCPRVEKLEICGCAHVKNSQLPSLTYIKDLPKLKTLTLIDLPFTVDWKFLIHVGRSCPELRSLTIQSWHDQISDWCFLHLLLALRYAKNLRELRLKNDGYSYSLQQLFDVLTPHGKIEHLLLCCSFEGDCNISGLVRSLDRFLSSNPQLGFLLIIYKNIPYTDRLHIKDTLKKYKRSEKQKFFCFDRKDDFYYRYFSNHAIDDGIRNYFF